MRKVRKQSIIRQCKYQEGEREREIRRRKGEEENEGNEEEEEEEEENEEEENEEEEEEERSPGMANSSWATNFRSVKDPSFQQSPSGPQRAAAD